MSTYAVILAGGSGRRMGATENKVFLPLRGIPAIVRAIAPFSSLCAGVILVVAPAEEERMRELLTACGMMRLVHAIVAGGEDRQASVYNGLCALPSACDRVLVHDGARALVTEAVIERVLASVEAHGTGIAAVSVTDTIKRVAPGNQIVETPDRSCLYAMQTPQGFETALLRRSHERSLESGLRATDDAALVEALGEPVFICEGDRENLKLTSPVDLALAEAILASRLERELLNS